MSAVADGNWRPTRTSTVVVLVVTVALAVALAVLAGPPLAVVIGAGDALLFAGSLWLVDRSQFRVVTDLLASVLALLVGCGFAMTAGYVALSLLSSLFPVDQASLIGPRGLVVVSSTMVVVGATVSMVGAVTAVGNVLRRETVEEYGSLATKTLALPGAVALVQIVSAILANVGSEGEGGPVSAVEGLLGTGIDALVAPAPGRLHLFTFALVVTVAAASLARVLEVLPVAELATAEGDGDPEAAVEAAASRLGTIAAGAALLAVVGLVLLFVPSGAVADLLTPAVYGGLAALTGSPLLRRLLVGMALVALVTLAVVRVARRLARTSARDALVAFVPVIAGGFVVAAVAFVHEPLLEAVLTFITTHLPGVFAKIFAVQSAAAIEYYGSFGIALALAATLLVVTSATAGWLTIAMRLNYLPDETAAPALAAAGLFVAAAFGGASGLAAPLVIAGVVASFLAWDLGEFGVTLGREVGRQARTRGTELVHLGASLAVGVIGALATLAVVRIARAQTVPELTTIPFAVVGVVVGLLLLFAALRR